MWCIKLVKVRIGNTNNVLVSNFFVQGVLVIVKEIIALLTAVYLVYFTTLLNTQFCVLIFMSKFDHHKCILPAQFGKLYGVLTVD